MPDSLRGMPDDRRPDLPGARWTTFGWLCWFVVTGALEALSDERSLAAGRVLALGAIYGTLNSLQLFAALRTTARYPVVGRRAWRHLVVHGASALATGAAFAAGDALATLLGHGTMPGPMRALQHTPGYLLLAVVAHAAVYARRARRAVAADRRLRERLERIGRHRAEAELRVLKAELHPLLLEDALDVATGLVRTDPARAQRVLVELGQMMREAVSRSTVREVTVEEELEALEPLVEIASAAHVLDEAGSDGRPWLLVEMDPELREALVPHLVLHPIVAHASRRARDDEALTLRIERADGDVGEERLALSVWIVPTARHAPERGADDPRHRERIDAATSQALATLRRRLTALHGDAATLRVGSVGEQMAAMVAIPFRADRIAAPIGAATDRRPSVPAPAGAPRGLVAGLRAAALEGWTLAIARRDVAPRSLWAAARAYLARHIARPSRDPLAVVVCIAVLLVGLGDALGVLVIAVPSSASPVVLTVGHALRVVAMGWLAIRLARLRPLAGDDGRTALTLHAGAVAAAAALAATTHALIGAVARHAGVAIPVGPPLTSSAPLFFGGLVVTYVVLAGAVHGITSVRGRHRSAQVVRELRLALATAAHQRTRAELRALKAELNPHFVGNALHTATALVRHDPAAAEHMLRSLGALAREAAAQTATEEVTLTQELACLQPFLAIESARLGLAAGALSVDWEVAPDVLDAWVPHSVLQPLVENAVRHGLAPRGGVGRLTVRARRTRHPRRTPAESHPAVPRVAAPAAHPIVHPTVHANGVDATWLELAVIDDGVGLTARSAANGAEAPHVSRPGTGGVGAGAGSRGIHGRLAALYGPLALFELVPGSESGTVARLVIPLRVAGAAAN